MFSKDTILEYMENGIWHTSASIDIGIYEKFGSFMPIVAINKNLETLLKEGRIERDISMGCTKYKVIPKD